MCILLLFEATRSVGSFSCVKMHTMSSCSLVSDLYHLKVNVTLAQFHSEVW